MPIVLSTATSVITLKAAGEKTLRVLPGHNEIKNLDPFMEDNPAAKAFAKQYFQLIDEKSGMTEEASNEIQNSKAKNEKLNRGKGVLNPPKRMSTKVS